MENIWLGWMVRVWWWGRNSELWNSETLWFQDFETLAAFHCCCHHWEFTHRHFSSTSPPLSPSFTSPLHHFSYSWLPTANQSSVNNVIISFSRSHQFISIYIQISTVMWTVRAHQFSRMKYPCKLRQLLLNLRCIVGRSWIQYLLQLVGFMWWIVPDKVAKIQWTVVGLVVYGCKLLRLATAGFHSSLSNLDPRICHGSSKTNRKNRLDIVDYLIWTSEYGKKPRELVDSLYSLNSQIP
jgi:hypothetical protein